ncbi:hypothetical protein GQ53DRAFT_219093 [Thozetella sp. PMI_491]|nr:hypothetical protein GQ53DRAFT_219093 [Thozetella sp. PMI_491]
MAAKNPPGGDRLQFVGRNRVSKVTAAAVKPMALSCASSASSASSVILVTCRASRVLVQGAPRLARHRTKRTGREGFPEACPADVAGKARGAERWGGEMVGAGWARAQDSQLSEPTRIALEPPADKTRKTNIAPPLASRFDLQMHEMQADRMLATMGGRAGRARRRPPRLDVVLLHKPGT